MPVQQYTFVLPHTSVERSNPAGCPIMEVTKQPSKRMASAEANAMLSVEL